MAVWYQDNVKHERLYWLAVYREDISEADMVVAEYSGQRMRIESSDLFTLHIRLNDHMMNLNISVTVRCKGETGYKTNQNEQVKHLLKPWRNGAIRNPCTRLKSR